MMENDQTVLTEPENKLPDFTFEQLPERMREAVKRLGWTRPMPVQAKATPYLLDNRDMIVQSRTGSGKTGAFLIPLILRIDPQKRWPQAIVLAPTRELASQIYREFEALSEGMGISGALVYGGVGYGAQLDALRGGAQVIIGTPGRVLDHVGRRSLNLDRIEILVFDEADEMLSMGFYPDMREIRRHLPRERSSWMFSATIPYRVQMLAEEFLRDPEFLSLSAGSVVVSTAEHRIYDVPPLEKDLMLMRLIEHENPDSAIIFSNTRQDVEYLATVLKNYGYNADQLSGDLDQKEREAAMGRIRRGETRFLVATDVAARGIDISDLSHVIQYDVPKDPDSYVHRAGRTARAGNTGVVMTFVANMSDRSDLKKIARRYEIDFVELPVPTEEEVEQKLAERVTVVLEDRFRTEPTRLQRQQMKRFVRLTRELAGSDDEVMLLAMLLDGIYRTAFHEQPPPAPEAAAPPMKASEPKSAPRRQESEERAPRAEEPPAERDEVSGEAEMQGEEGEKKRKKRRRRRKKRGGDEGGRTAQEMQRDDAAAEEEFDDVDELEEETSAADVEEAPAGPTDASPPEQRRDAGREKGRGRDERRNEERRGDERRNDDARQDERPRDERTRDERRREDRSRPDERGSRGEREERRSDQGRRDEGRRDEKRREEPRRDESRRDESRRDESRRDESRRDQGRRDEPRRDEPRRQEERSGERGGRSEQPRQEGPRRDGERQERSADKGRRDNDRGRDRDRDRGRGDDRGNRGGRGREREEETNGFAGFIDEIEVFDPEPPAEVPQGAQTSDAPSMKAVGARETAPEEQEIEAPAVGTPVDDASTSDETAAGEADATELESPKKRTSSKGTTKKPAAKKAPAKKAPAKKSATKGSTKKAAAEEGTKKAPAKKRASSKKAKDAEEGEGGENA